MKECDFLVVGAGIGGASAAYGLAQHGSVIIVEKESQPGYHTTGRSAAFYAETYGNNDVSLLTSGSKSFFLSPPAGFCETPLITDRSALYIARRDQLTACDKMFRSKSSRLPSLVRLDTNQIQEIAPYIRINYPAGAVFDPECKDIDVNNLHQGFLRAARKFGAELATNQQVKSLQQQGRYWITITEDFSIRSKIVVNASGAWGDEIAQLAGIGPMGLVPKRRTIVIGSLRTGQVNDSSPLVLDIEDQFYFKPENGHILASPGDETPMPPCDVQPDEMDIAVAIDRVEKVSTLEIDRIINKWAGLRTFTKDQSPIIGMDPIHDGFFWAVGQGGFGIQTAPAISTLIHSLVIDNKVPDHLKELGVKANMFAPGRLRSPS